MHAALENGHAVGILHNDGGAHLLEEALALETGRVSVIGRHERVALQAWSIASALGLPRSRLACTESGRTSDFQLKRPANQLCFGTAESLAPDREEESAGDIGANETVPSSRGA